MSDLTFKSNLQKTLSNIIERPIAQQTIIVLIIINAILLGLETSTAIMAIAGDLIILADQIILGIFVIEILTRIYIHRLAFWRDPWSVFDFSVVAIALVPASGPLAVLRALRVLRVLRLLTMVPSMRRVVGALLSAIPGLLSIAFVLLIIYYVFAVIATNLFGDSHSMWFGSIGDSLYSLFQIMTLESWSMGIVRPLMETYPYAWAFFIPFILIATFTMLNLFIAIIVNAMQKYNENDKQETTEALHKTQEHIESELHLEIHGLREELKEIKRLLKEGIIKGDVSN